MPQYLVAGYLPDDFDPSKVDEATGRDIHALNKEMIAAGVRKFACGLGSAKSLRAQSDGAVLITDGPYLETKEHIGGVLDIGMCRHGRSGGMGAQRRCHHPRAGRGARDLLQPVTRLTTGQKTRMDRRRLSSDRTLRAKALPCEKSSFLRWRTMRKETVGTTVIEPE